jgi:Family of unknown function (DUF5317)
MILLLAIIVSVAIALLRGGQFATLLRVPVRWGVLAVAAFAIQALFIYRAPSQRAQSIWSWQEWLFFASHLLLLGMVWANRNLAGVKLIGLGLLLNLAVMVANGGWMPVTPEAVAKVGYSTLAPSLEPGMRLYSSKNILLPAEQTELQFLSDIFLLARPFPVPSVFSLGDVAVAAGVWALIQSAMLGRESSSGQGT